MRRIKKGNNTVMKQLIILGSGACALTVADIAAQLDYSGGVRIFT
jgi:hypothetical protein